MEFFENVAKIFTSFTVVDALVIVLFALMFYYVFRILKISNVRVVIAVFVLLVLATGAVFIFTDTLNGEAYMVVPIVLSGVVLVIFNVEVKRDILNMHSFNMLSEISNHQASVTKDEAERYVADIIKALQNLSKDNIGALIIPTFRRRFWRAASSWMRTSPRSSSRASSSRRRPCTTAR